MNVTKIIYENMRGGTRSLALSNRTILLGDNMTGKTTALDAIELAIQGSLYRLGKKADALLALFLAGSLTVTAHASGASTAHTSTFSVSRTWKRKRSKTGLSVDAEIRVTDEAPKSKLADKEAIIRAKLGTCSAALDLSELMDLTPGQQRKFLFGFADLSALGWSPEAVFEKIRARVLTGELELDEYRRETAQGWLEKMSAEWGHAVDLEEGLQRLAEFAEEQLRIQKAIADEAQKAVRAMLDAPGAAAGTVTAGDVEAAQKAADSLAGELAKLEAALKTADADMAAAKARTEKIEQLERQVQMFGTAAAAEEDSVAKSQLEQARQDMTRISDVSDDLVAGAQIDVDLTATRVAELAAAQATQERDGKALKAKIEGIEHLANCDCPTCLRVLSPEDAERIVANWRKELAELGDKWRRAKTETDAAKACLESKRSQLNELRSKQVARRQAQEKATECERLIERAVAARKLREQQLGEAQERLAALRGEAAAAGPVADATTLRSQVTGTRELLYSARERLTNAQRAYATAGVEKNQKVRQHEAEVNVEILSSIKTAVGPNGLQGEVVKTLAAPITTTANKLLQLVNPAWMFGIRMRDERGAESFAMGWERAGGFVSWPNLSNGQRAIFAAALAIALIRLTDPPLKLLKVDNLEAVDEQHSRALLEALTKMTAAGDLQVIVAGVEARGGVPDGWLVHRLDRLASAVREPAEALEAAK